MVIFRSCRNLKNDLNQNKFDQDIETKKFRFLPIIPCLLFFPFPIFNSFPIAQGPLNRTCFDFWRMCWEKNSKNVIMLNKLMENGRVKCARYWPEEVDQQLNFQVEDVTFSVTLLVKDSHRFSGRKLLSFFNQSYKLPPLVVIKK